MSGQVSSCRPDAALHARNMWRGAPLLPCRFIRAERALAAPPLWRILSALRQEIVGQIGENLECTRQSLALLAQKDFVGRAGRSPPPCLRAEPPSRGGPLASCRTRPPAWSPCRYLPRISRSPPYPESALARRPVSVPRQNLPRSARRNAPRRRRARARQDPRRRSPQSRASPPPSDTPSAASSRGCG